MQTKGWVVTAAALSAALMLFAARHNPSLLLRLIFLIWVLLPYLALLRFPTLAGLIPILTLAPLVLYAAVAFDVVPLKLGAVFLLAPAACWLMIAVRLIRPR